VAKGFQSGPADDDIPLAGDASALWTTDYAASRNELPGTGVARERHHGGDSGDALAHFRTPRFKGLTATAAYTPLEGAFKRKVDSFATLSWFSLSRDRLLVAWVLGLTASAGGLCAGLLLSGYRVEKPVPVAVLVLLALVAERQSIRLSATVEVSIASLVCVFAAIEFGPISGALVAVAGMLVHLWRRDGSQTVLRWAAWTSVRCLATVSAGLAAGAILEGGHDGFWTLFAAVASAFAADTAVDFALFPVAPMIRGTASFRALMRSAWPVNLGSLPLHTLVIAVLAYSYETISPWSVALFVIPAIAAQRLFMLYREQQDTLSALESVNTRLASANLSFATALVATLDARDRYTAGHSTAVAIYARDIAQRMGLSSSEQELAHLCGLVHDVGKIGLSAGLLEKPGALTLEERREMERHSEIGEDILRNVADYGEIAAVVRSHHERVDGTGYPDRLCGDEIPVLARIIAVADAYNAMTSDRPYRDAMPSRVARLRLAQAVESQFDTTVVAAFEAILASVPEDYRLARGDSFELQSVVRAHVGPGEDRSPMQLRPVEAVG
jgi:putative nucleotidyltransferase with HDIG domain